MRYQALAPVYDRLMNHVGYDDWTVLIRKIFKKYCLVKNPSVLEIGGGTAMLAQDLTKTDIDYTGSDYSFDMCREAAKKSFSFFCCDCRNLAVKKKFDLVLFLYDGINYLQTLQDYSQLFNEVYSCLNDNGLFLFDITTETNSIKHFYDYLDFEDYEDISLIRHSYYDDSCSNQYNEFTIFSKIDPNANTFRKFNEIHIQKVFPVKSIEETIPVSKFKIIGIWDDFSFRKYSIKSERIHFLIRKIC